MEVSLHLIEQVVQTVAPGTIAIGSTLVPVGSTGGMYLGALIVIGPGTANEEVVAITAINPGVSFTATFTKTHPTNTVIIAPTFPTQQPTDPFFTQSEMLDYLARAQNEFIARVPFYYQLTRQNTTLNQSLYTAPSNMVMIERIASAQLAIPIATLTRTANRVTAAFGFPHGITSAWGPINIYSATDPTFTGVFQPDVFNATTLEWPQQAADASTTAGLLGQFYRLYERSREELSFSNPNWMNENISELSSWGEDRSGNYGWFINGRPQSNFPMELICTIRDADVLTLLDGFLVPDTLLHIIKYRVLQYAWQKDGDQRQPSLANYAGMRFERGVLAAQRFVDQVIDSNQQTYPTLRAQNG